MIVLSGTRQDTNIDWLLIIILFSNRKGTCLILEHNFEHEIESVCVRDLTYKRVTSSISLADCSDTKCRLTLFTDRLLLIFLLHFIIIIPDAIIIMR